MNVDDPAFEEKLQQIFDRYDDDGSGEIDAVRSPAPASARLAVGF